MTTQPGTTSGSHGKLQAGVHLGEYILGQPLWPTRIADAYRANGPNGAATIYVIHAHISTNTQVRDYIIAGTRAAAALPEHKHLVHTIAAGLTGDILWIATEEVDGSLVRDMLIKKKQQGTSGFGVRGTGNLITGVSLALNEVTHGALSTESVIVSRTGRVRVTDLALGLGTLAAMRAGIIPMAGYIAPEVQSSGTASATGDVYALGALIYEALIGTPFDRANLVRPSEVIKGAPPAIDEIIARACHQNPDKRFPRADVIGDIVSEALGGTARPVRPTAPPEPGAGASLAQSLGDSGANLAGNSVVDRALAAALADTTEKFLISKGRLDYGPFSLADVVKQIEKGDIVGGNIIMDKDTGSRGDVADHPLLGPVVDTAKQRRDDQRRAHAEAKMQTAHSRRGAILYAFILLGVLGAAAGVYFIIQKVRGDDNNKKIASVAKVESGELKVTVSLPKVPPKVKHTGGGRRGGGGGGPGGVNSSEDLSLDMSDESDETETLGMDKVYAVYSGYGRQLGGCLASNGGGAANIGIIIDGPSGRVKWVKVNGQQSGGLYNCMSRVLRGMQFPKINGPRTRAEFDINL